MPTACPNIDRIELNRLLRMNGLESLTTWLQQLPFVSPCRCQVFINQAER